MNEMGVWQYVYVFVEREIYSVKGEVLLLLRLLDSPFVFCVVVDVVAVVAAAALFGRFRRIFSTWPRVHVPARFAPLLTCCEIRLNSAVKSKNDMMDS